MLFVVCRCTILLTLCSQVPCTFELLTSVAFFVSAVKEYYNKSVLVLDWCRHVIQQRQQRSQWHSPFLYQQQSWGNTCGPELWYCNCSGQNKNRFVLWNCAWRTMHKLLHSLDLHFLITGRAKFAPDWCFGFIKQHFIKTTVNILSEIAGVVKDSTVTGVNIPQLVGLEDGTVLVESYGWQQPLISYFRPLPQIKQYQHFRWIEFSLNCMRLFFLSKLQRWIDVGQGCNIFSIFFPCFNASRLWSLVSMSPSSVWTQSGPCFSCCATLTSFLPKMVCLYTHHLDWTQLDKLTFLRRSGSFVAKRL